MIWPQKLFFIRDYYLSFLYHPLHHIIVSVTITGNNMQLIRQKNPVWFCSFTSNYEDERWIYNPLYYLEKVRLLSVSKRPFCSTECQALLLQSSSSFNSVPSHIRECERVCFQAQTQDPSLQFIYPNPGPDPEPCPLSQSPGFYEAALSHLIAFCLIFLFIFSLS